MQIKLIGRSDHIMNGLTKIADIRLNIEVLLTQRQLTRILTDYEALVNRETQAPLHLVGSGVSLNGAGPLFLGHDLASGLVATSYSSAIPPRPCLDLHLALVSDLRQKGCSYRTIAMFLRKDGFDVDHTTVYRFCIQNKLA